MICPGALFDLVWSCWRWLDVGVVRILDAPFASTVQRISVREGDKVSSGDVAYVLIADQG